MNRTLVVMSIAALFVGAGLLPATSGQLPLVDVSLGVVYEESFDDGPAGWTANEYDAPTRPAPEGSWEHGVVASGPGAGFSGTQAWATNLEGDYGANECAALLSPVIDLTSASSASVSFAQWFESQVSSWSGDVYDGVTLFATRDGGVTFDRLEPAGGYSDRIFWSPTRDCMDDASYGTEAFGGSSGGWVTTQVDLSAYAGDAVRFVIAFGSSSSSHDAGWYVDDFAVTVDGVTTTEDFENGDGGFTLVSTAPPPLAPQGWEHGVASVGPGTDSPLWGINLDGDYGPNECSSLESPPIVLGEDVPNAANAAVRATLSWNQWFRTAAGTGAGVVQIGTADGSYTNVIPVGGYSDTKYLKDAHEACLEYASQESGAFAGNIDREGDAMVEYAADVSQWLGEEVTIRFLFATSDFSYSGNTGWYVDDVAVELALYAESPVEPADLVPEVPDPTAGTDPVGWSSGGEDSTWAYGVATSGPEGETVYKTNLNGPATSRECSWVDSPAVPGALLALDPTLVIDHWYELYYSSFSGPWGAGVVLVSTDGGVTWEHLQVDGYVGEVRSSIPRSCFRDAHGLEYPVPGAFGGTSEGFETATADLSAYTSADTVQFRFLFHGYLSSYEGWALRGVTAGGVSLL